MNKDLWLLTNGLTPTMVVCLMVAVASCVPSAEPGDRDEASAVPAEITDGLLSVIIFPVLDEPFIAPDLTSGALPWRGSAEHFKGIDIDIMVGFAKEMDVEVEFLRLEEPGFGSLLPALAAGRADAVASAVTITEERDQLVDFSRPYFEVATVVVTRTGSSLRSVADLAGKTGVGVRGSRPITVLHDLGFDGTMIETDFQTGAYAAVVEGAADFAILESASAVPSVRGRDALEIAFSLPGRENYGFAIAQDSALRSLLDAYLTRIEADGTLASILGRHLGAS